MPAPQEISNSDEHKSDPFALTIDILDQHQLDKKIPYVDFYRALVYSIYTTDGSPQTIEKPNNQGEEPPVFVVARNPNLQPLLSHRGNEQLKKVYTGLHRFTDLAGFFRIDKGSSITHIDELSELFTWKGSALSAPLTYFSQFTPNPLLPKQIRLQSLNGMFSQACEYARQENLHNHMYVVLAEHVVNFVRNAGIQIKEITDATLNTNHPTTQSLIQNFPGYWTNNPKLFRFIPFALQEES